MIRAIYRDGTVQLLENVPAEWTEGKELEIHELQIDATAQNSDTWLARLNAVSMTIPPRVHDELAIALAQIEAESKEQARREMGLSE